MSNDTLKSNEIIRLVSIGERINAAWGCYSSGTMQEAD
jgi:hypothetical protein